MSFYLTEEHLKTAEKNGIKRQTVHSRVWTLGWDPDRAVTQIPKTPGNSFFTNEEKVKLENLGVSECTARNRIEQHGWSREKALTTPLQRQGRRKHANNGN